MAMATSAWWGWKEAAWGCRGLTPRPTCRRSRCCNVVHSINSVTQVSPTTSTLACEFERKRKTGKGSRIQIFLAYKVRDDVIIDLQWTTRNWEKNYLGETVRSWEENSGMKWNPNQKGRQDSHTLPSFLFSFPLLPFFFNIVGSRAQFVGLFSISLLFGLIITGLIKSLLPGKKKGKGPDSQVKEP